MQIDITLLLTNSTNILSIDDKFNIPKEMLSKSLIEDLKNLTLTASIKFNEENELILTGIIKGIMILKDDITLEPMEYKFTTDIEENLNKNQKILDITDILWQNILVEIPSKVRITNEDIEISGEGWRVISEDKFNEERNKANNPFSNLNELLNEKEEK